MVNSEWVRSKSRRGDISVAPEFNPERTKTTNVFESRRDDMLVAPGFNPEKMKTKNVFEPRRACPDFSGGDM